VNALPVALYTLPFPAQWYKDVLTLMRVGKKKPEQIKNIYISGLNTAIAALAPDVISCATSATADEKRPWLYADEQLPPETMQNLIAAWLYGIRPDPGEAAHVQKAWANLEAFMPKWQKADVNLLEHSVSDGGTVEPASHLYRVLTDYLATRIEHAEKPYEYCGQRVSFRRVATPVTGNGAELVSWPPHEYSIPATPKYPERKGWYSGVITIALRTEPFSAIPRIHLGFGIRRWITREKGIWVPRGRDVSVYLLAPSALWSDAPTPERMALARLRYDKRARKMVWSHGGPNQLLSRLTTAHHLPDAASVAADPTGWLAGKNCVVAAATHHTTMGGHLIGSGIMPLERQRLYAWVREVFAPDFVPLAPLRRADIPRSQSNAIGLLVDKEPIKKLKQELKPKRNATAEEVAKVEEENKRRVNENKEIEKENRERRLRNAEITAANGRLRRAATAPATRSGILAIRLLYQTVPTRDALIAALEQSLALEPHRDEQGPTSWSWSAPDLTVRLHVAELGSLGADLGEAKAPKMGDELDQAIAARRAQVGVRMHVLQESLGTEPAILGFIELADYRNDPNLEAGNDPKSALRLGCADAGLVTQFITPIEDDDTHAEDGEDYIEHRALAAVGDGLRQLGVRLIPRHSLEGKLPTSFNQLAFWLVRRRADTANGHRQFTPIAILIRPGQDLVVGRSPKHTGWVPYPRLLLDLTGEVRGEDLATEQLQTEAAAAFFKQTLDQFRGEDTLLITHAQNTRSRWPWLTNAGLAPDRIAFGRNAPQRLSFHYRKLRVARITSNDRFESPQWWAQELKDQDSPEFGIAKGLWVPAGADTENRIFYSSAEKISTNSTAKDDTKLTPHPDSKGVHRLDPTKPASTPSLLQLAMAGLQEHEDPASWAMFIHQQRDADDYRGWLALPLILHLADLTNEYALPFEAADEDTAVVADSVESEDAL
jgi:hypothetical protein